MTRRALLFPLILLGCSAEVGEAPSPPPSREIDPSLQPASWHAKRAAARPPPEGLPLSRKHLEGVFPPAWRAGDRWRVVVHETKRSTAAAPDPIYLHKKGFLFEVVQEPDGPDGEYLIDIRRFFLPEELARVPPNHRPSMGPREHFSAKFWARDGTLIWCRDEDREEDALRARIGNGPHPFVDAEEVSWTGTTPPPVHAFPALPARLENPLLYSYSGAEQSARGWQRITPTEDGAIIEISEILLTFGEPTGQSDARLVWRRGDPWWSLHTSRYRLADPPQGKGVELEDGYQVYGRLLRDEPE